MRSTARQLAAPLLLLAAALTAAALPAAAQADNPLLTLSRERVVFQTEHGDIHFGFYQKAAPNTVEHIKRCAELGLYNTNHIFRVDKGFVAQVDGVENGRKAPMNALQQEVAQRRVPLEVHDSVRHDRRGILSMARYDDPNSGGSSFSMLLGPAPHLDKQYTIFGLVTQGLDTLAKLEELPTRKEGIFVMPLDRISILSTYMYVVDDSASGAGAPKLCTEALAQLQVRYDAQSAALENIRKERLPGR
ncbi:hypothetical protein COHA_002153 [Chlorella ohadii]|uniref:PPIase cyclophilin-type domain-containing protein n=1 Tax=Chlorella ohadii TaxID=2649997 RepID=A0AAD5H8C1_9CHLO|nr:hypothetical protein COHA_002153 [Chlorella ohadii]